MITVNSINKIPIRLTNERWLHIVENHDEMAGYYYDVLETISNPLYIFEGNIDEKWAVKLINENKALLVIYKEQIDKKDGFIITSFITSKVDKLFNRKLRWKQQK